MTVIYSDTHFYAPHSLDDLLKRILKEDPNNTMLLGDIVDLKNCWEKDFKKAVDLKNNLIEYFGLNYCSGNHELDPFNIFRVLNGVLYSHSDYFYYSNKEWNKWYYHKKAASMKWWKYHAIKHKEIFRDSECNVSTIILDKIVEKAIEFECNTVRLGHKHPREKYINLHKGIKIEIYPRGRHEID